ncbi:MAG: hypothetical protein HYV09_40550 [Deltaproteobacteria bacterium]|nr:hypothetical protein [Deltaproteobacteria bacterium]
MTTETSPRATPPIDAIDELQRLLDRARAEGDPEHRRVLFAEVRIQARRCGERLSEIAMNLDELERELDGAGVIG